MNAHCSIWVHTTVCVKYSVCTPSISITNDFTVHLGPTWLRFNQASYMYMYMCLLHPLPPLTMTCTHTPPLLHVHTCTILVHLYLLIRWRYSKNAIRLQPTLDNNRRVTFLADQTAATGYVAEQPTAGTCTYMYMYLHLYMYMYVLS